MQRTRDKIGGFGSRARSPSRRISKLLPNLLCFKYHTQLSYLQKKYFEGTEMNEVETLYYA